MRLLTKLLPAALFACLLAIATWASITGSISGVVTDSSGGAVAGVKVTAAETRTGVRTEITTDSAGFYNFPNLAIGTYDLEVTANGFKAYRQSGLVIDANSALRVDVTLQVGSATENVTVRSDAVHVETESTQNGEVIDSRKIESVPLNGRAYTDLLSLQPGVVPAAYAKQVQGQLGGLNDRQASGDLNPGNQAVNGQRGSANGFMVNGALVEEGKNNGTAIVPNLDSIEEFRIITNNFDAEYGNFSGGQINVATKAGTNSLHGSAFEFLRNTALDARNFFDLPGHIGDYKQNQFGATVGGPIKKDTLFFFADYQGTRLTKGDTLTNAVPSVADRPNSTTGFADVTDLTSKLSGTVQGSNWASILSQRLGYAVTPGEAYYAPGCVTTIACVFPNAHIPNAAVSPISMNLLNAGYIQQPNAVDSSGNPLFTTSAFPQTLRDDKGAIRIDDNTRFGTISGYYFIDDFYRDDPYPNQTVAGVNGSMPGFDSVTPSRSQLFSFGLTKTISSTAVNEFHLSFLRTAGSYFKPKGGLGVSLTSLGFPAPTGTGSTFNGGLAPIDPTVAGVPQITLSQLGVSIGVPQDTTNQYNNTYQILDNYTKIIGTHSLKFGGQFHYDQINERNFFGENGAFTFDGSETGADFVDFLLGAPQGLIQASKQVLDSRSKYGAAFAQDSWRVKPSLTLNLGLRWEFSQPWYDTQGKTETIIPGKQSVLYPGAPQGWVVPGDPGVPSTLAPTKWDAFSPRLGLAYSPNTPDGWLGKITGGPGKMSIRAGFGIYYTSVEDLSQFLEVGDVPFGLFYVTPSHPLFDTPFVDRASGTGFGQKFPFFPPPLNVSAKNPDTTFPWANVLPISSCFCFFNQNRMPYSEHFELSVQRQLSSNTVLSVSYVGNEGHRLVTSIEASPAPIGFCNELAGLGAIDPSSGSTCGPGGENPPSGYFLPFGVPFPTDTPAADKGSGPCIANPSQTCNVVTSTRILGPNFGENPYVKEVANSVYHSLQTTLRHTSGISTFLVGYTFSKCLDNASGLQDVTSVFNPRASRSLCAIDVTHNFVVSYTVRLPVERLFHNTDGWAPRLLGGWELSGITTFATGIPVTISQNTSDDFSQTGATGVETPNFTPGKILNNTNPRSGQPYFNTSLFFFSGCASINCPGDGTQQLGQIGNANRRFFHGPGINNWDMALLKNFKFTESKLLEFRFEAFNIFNHAQFQNPNGTIDAGYPSQGGQFGLITVANDPRIMQAALKFRF